ncbi:MAG: hypothetical protein AMXMBFR33_48050 [Candidatus Xenobia bacterium]
MHVGLSWSPFALPVGAARQGGRATPDPTKQVTRETLKNPEGALAKVSREQRRTIVNQMVQSAPHLATSPQQLREPLDSLEREIRLTGKSQCGFSMGVGFTATRTYVASPPPQRATLQEAVSSYRRYLDIITHAEGRRDPKVSEADQDSACTCFAIEHNYLHRQSERVALFERLVGLLHSPWNALGVLQDLETVPEERREGVMHELTSRVQALRARTLSPQNLTDALNEGAGLHNTSRKLALAGKVQRPGESLNDLFQEIPEAKRALFGELKSDLWIEAIGVAASFRQPSETLSEGTRRFVPAFASLQTLTGLDYRSTLELMAQLPESNTEQVEQLELCGQYLRSLKDLPREVASGALKAAFASDKKPIDALKRSMRSFELTGDVHGLEKAAATIHFKLENGSLIGTEEEWQRKLEHRLEELRLFEPDARKAFARAKRELFESQGSHLGSTDAYFLIGSSRIPIRRPLP